MEYKHLEHPGHILADEIPPHPTAQEELSAKPFEGINRIAKLKTLKILAPCSTLDFSYRLGCTPSWWQLLKAFHEAGNEVIATPYLGDPIESLWWRIYKNPCRTESILYNKFLENKKRKGKLSGRAEISNSILNKLAERYVRPKWEKHIISILDREKDIDAIFFMNVPINHIKGIPTRIREQYGIPVAFLEGDMPTILPQYAADRGFRFNYYTKADLSEYDLFFTNSKGVIPDLERMGAKKVVPLYYAVDPVLFSPIPVKKKIDVSYFGFGSEYREEWMTKMITEPSIQMSGTNFSVGGRGFQIDLGNAHQVGDLSYSAFRNFCCSSRICLNITRKSHTAVYGSSTARPFELAGYGACIVSQPYNGIEEWFEVGKELTVVSSAEEARETYSNLLDNPDKAMEMGERARRRVFRDHTFRKRAEEVMKQFGQCKVGG